MSEYKIKKTWKDYLQNTYHYLLGLSLFIAWIGGVAAFIFFLRVIIKNHL